MRYFGLGISNPFQGVGGPRRFSQTGSLALADICPWPLGPFLQISLKNSELKTTHNTFPDCRVHFFRQPFSKLLYIDGRGIGEGVACVQTLPPPLRKNLRRRVCTLTREGGELWKRPS